MLPYNKTLWELILPPTLTKIRTGDLAELYWKKYSRDSRIKGCRHGTSDLRYAKCNMEPRDFWKQHFSNARCLLGIMVDYVATPEACLSASHPGEEALLPDLSDYKINRHFCPAKWTGSRAQQTLGCCRTWASTHPAPASASQNCLGSLLFSITICCNVRKNK